MNAELDQQAQVHPERPRGQHPPGQERQHLPAMWQGLPHQEQFAESHVHLPQEREFFLVDSAKDI